MLPARYGRLWTVAVAAIIAVMLVAALRTRSSFQVPLAPGSAGDGQQKAAWIEPSSGPSGSATSSSSSSSSGTTGTVATTTTSTTESSQSSESASKSSTSKVTDAEHHNGGDPTATTATTTTTEHTSTQTDKLPEGAPQETTTETDAGASSATSPSEPLPDNDTAQPESAIITKAVVMGRRTEEDTAWIEEELPDWQRAIYYVNLPDNETSPTGLRTRMNKAREAMPYLTYIIDHYPDFPDVTAFIHPHAIAWHNDAKDNRAVYMLQELQLPTVLERGYVNLRCNNEVGCPREIIPFREPPLANKHAEHIYAEVYSAFFHVNDTQMRKEIPVVATQCCAQFAVSRAQLCKRPKQDYERYRAYLEETEHDDEAIGRVMEYMWHIIFGREAVHCENVWECWCKVYNRCGEFSFWGHPWS